MKVNDDEEDDEEDNEEENDPMMMMKKIVISKNQKGYFTQTKFENLKSYQSCGEGWSRLS